jgi:Terminase small subunit
MPIIDNSKQDQFAQLVVKGVSATKAYISAGYSPKGASTSAARMLAIAPVCSRVRELQEAISASTIALEISTRNARVTALQKRWDRLRSGLELILDQRGAEMAHVSGGASGMLCRDYKGKERFGRLSQSSARPRASGGNGPLRQAARRRPARDRRRRAGTKNAGLGRPRAALRSQRHARPRGPRRTARIARAGATDTARPAKPRARREAAPQSDVRLGGEGNNSPKFAELFSSR